MKILVVSLLRLGDIIQQEPLLRGLREKHPEAEIHLLMNRQFAGVEKVLHGVVDKYVHFDRETLQRGLGESGFNIFYSYSILAEWVRSLNGERYDLAYNFTHNKLSAYLLGALEIPEKRGLYQAEGRFRGLDNRWLRYFNDRFSGSAKSLFHYVELLGNSFNLPVQPQAAGVRKKSKKILFQCLTSQAVKNWGLDNFLELKETIEKALVDYKVQILGAPFERETLAAVFAENDLLICDLAEARKHLQDCALLVTGDTSIKHLAAQMGVPLVELVLGTSDAVKTGAYSENARILTEEINVQNVFTAVWDELSGEQQRVENTVASLEKAVWKLYLDKADQDSQPRYVEMLHQLMQAHQEKSLSQALIGFQERSQVYLTWQKRIAAAMPSRDFLAKRKNVSASDVAELILVAQDIIKSKKDEAGYFQGFLDCLLARYSQATQILDRVQDALNDQAELLAIRENLTRHLQSLSREGAYYAKGIGQLSIGGFEETGKSLQRNLEDAEL